MYNKSEIMKAAWELYREKVAMVSRLSKRDRQEILANYFSVALKTAWRLAKQRAKDANLSLEELESRLFLLQMKDRWDSNDYALEHKYSGAIKAMKARDTMKEVA